MKLIGLLFITVALTLIAACADEKDAEIARLHSENALLRQSVERNRELIGDARDSIYNARNSLLDMRFGLGGLSQEIGRAHV